MAQYYQVLSQEDKNVADELRQYYPNIVENQTVQYVISSEDQQAQFQGQQILLSSDQLMVIDSQNQQLIVDQTGTYQNSQYVLQDNTTDYSDAHGQSIYYMEEVDSEHSTPVDQAPLVLNHQLQQTAAVRNQLGTVQKSVLSVQTQVQQQMAQQSNRPAQISGVREIQQQSQAVTTLQQDPQQIQQTQSPLIQQHTSLTRKSSSQIVQTTSRSSGTPQQLPEGQRLHFAQSNLDEEHMADDSNIAVTLADGRVMRVSDYKMLANRQTNSNNASSHTPERMNSSLCKYEPNVNHNSKLKNSRGSNSNRSIRSRSNANSARQQRQFVTSPQISSPQKQQCLPQNQYLQQLPQPSTLRQQNHTVQTQSQSSYVQPQYIIQPPSQQQQHSTCPLPPYILSSRLQQIIENTPISEEYSDSIRMLVLLESGEQRLITFTLPKEVCTIQEILDQVGVPFQSDTKIELTETNFGGINYVVTVGNLQPEVFLNQQHCVVSEQVNSQPNSQNSTEMAVSPPTTTTTVNINSLTSAVEECRQKSPSPEPQAEIELPRYVPGLLAVCNHCGYTSENFNRCLRCKFKLPEDVKTVLAAINDGKRDCLKNIQSLDKKGIGRLLNGAQKKKKQRMVDPEPVVLTLSSDDEEQEPASNKTVETDQIIKRLNNSSITLSAIKKEPSMSDIQNNSFEATGVKGGGKEDMDGPSLSTTLSCRTIRVGSYKFVPIDNVIVNSGEIIFKAPNPKDPTVFKTIIVKKSSVIKVLACFQKMLCVLFYYVSSDAGESIRNELEMVEGDEHYFDPMSQQESFKRITFLPEFITEEARTVIKHIYGKPLKRMEELTTKEANDILILTCPKDTSKAMETIVSRTEVKQLLIYPPGKGGLSINTEDYFCLGRDQFLNDVVIDFYLKYLVLNLPADQQEKVHVFSTFFYKRLTTKPTKASRRSHPAEVDPSLTASQKRHARVEKWTKNVNLFEKDFIIIPINESCHWFLAIICFPGLDGSVTMEDGRPIQIEPKQRKKKNSTTTIGNVTITTVKQEKDMKPIPCDDFEGSDKDEAEGDESELESVDENEEAEPEKVQFSKRPPIKEPCILIFDSLAGASRNRVVATLRDYLTCEYKIKMTKEKIFNKDTIKGSCPKVPQQTNFTDCGLYLLQYVEQFFKDPIKDYFRPIKAIKNWFDEIVVTRKREEIANLIKDLMKDYGKDISGLPELSLPTLNGKVLEHFTPEDEEEEFPEDFEDEEFNEDTSVDKPIIEPLLVPSRSNTVREEKMWDDKEEMNSSEESVTKSGSFVELPITNITSLKPDTSETQKSSRDTLSYLKAKRINRHKSNESVTNIKRFKSSE